MRKYLILISTFLFLTACADSSEITTKGPYFWKAEKENQVMYILGTFHYGISLKELQCSDTISSSLEQSNFLWTEIGKELQEELQELIPVEIIVQEFFKKQAIDKSGNSFTSLNKKTQDFFLNKETQDLLNKLNIAEDVQVQDLSYFGLYSLLDGMCTFKNKEILQKIIEDFQKLYNIKLDVEIQELANTHNILQASLDEKHYILDLYKTNVQSINDFHMRIEDIEEKVKGYNKECSPENFRKKYGIVDQLKELLEKYKRGESLDVLTLLRTAIKNFGYLDDEQTKISEDHFIHNLLRKRNEIWVKKLLSAYESNKYSKVFVAAGTAHFIGPYNVLDMLKKENFSIKRFNSECLAE